MIFIPPTKRHGGSRSVDNLLPNSENFAATPYFLQGNLIIVAGSWADPVGGNNATKLTTNGTTITNFEIFPIQTVGTSTVQTLSLYVKAGTYTSWKMRILSNTGGTISEANYDLTAVTAVNSTGTGATITAVVGYSGWYRCALVYTPSNTQYNAHAYMNIIPTTTTGSVDYLYVFGAMLNLGAVALPYQKK